MRKLLLLGFLFPLIAEANWTLDSSRSEISFISIKNLNLASKQPVKPEPKKQQKRKNPNPNIAHNIDIGGSVVLGNPDAKVSVTKFTDFQ